MSGSQASARPVALITGGSQGIGYELARCFARDGHDVVLVARDSRKLETAAAEISAAFHVRAHPIAQDLSKPGAAGRLFSALQERELAIDVLVNNAGFGSYGEFASSDLQHDLDMMRLDMESLAVLTRLFLPQMLARGRGGILNVGSTAGFQPGPLVALYYAAKAFVLSFTEALANELQGSGVRVSVLCPGPTSTGFQDRAGVNNALFRRGVMSASHVAKIGYRDFKRGKTTIIPGFRNKLLAFAVRFAPRALVPRIVRRLQENRAPQHGRIAASK